MIEEPFVPIEDVAKHFAVSVSTVRTWIREQIIPSLKIGGVYRFRLSEVEAALRSIGGKGEPPLPSGTQMDLNLDLLEDL